MQLPPYLPPERFKQIYFGDSKSPSMPTIRRWLATGILPGRKVGGLLFVDVAAFEAMGNPLVEKILRHESRTA